MHHAARCCPGQRSRSPAGGGCPRTGLLDLPLPGRPCRAGHQPQLRLHVSAASFPLWPPRTRGPPSEHPEPLACSPPQRLPRHHPWPTSDCSVAPGAGIPRWAYGRGKPGERGWRLPRGHWPGGRKASPSPEPQPPPPTLGGGDGMATVGRLPNHSRLGPGSVRGSSRRSSGAACPNTWSEAPRGG